MSKRKSPTKVEFGDFQTPPELAHLVCQRLSKFISIPQTIIEPTCGQGNMLLAALNEFPQYSRAVGLDINADYIGHLEQSLDRRSDQSPPDQSPHKSNVQLLHEDFFQTDWAKIFNNLPEPLLIIGNPPWVTSAGLSTINSDNLPQKRNLHGFAGLDAMTGKSNFDISEWMLLHLLEQLKGRAAILAMLCKTTVARRVLTFAWQHHLKLSRASLTLVDAKHYFGAAVDACLFVCDIEPALSSQRITQHCDLYDDLSAIAPYSTMGYSNNQLIANLVYYERWQHLRGTSLYQWRSGIKHDCAKVMELTKDNVLYTNGLGESNELESTYIYGLLKSSDLVKTDMPVPRRYLIVPQKRVGEETAPLKLAAPQTWNYLNEHGDLLDKRKSSIYKKQPRFAIFGVGSYSFAPWKVAIAGLYKTLHFAIVGPHQGKSVVLDDTCYFIPCATQEEAELLAHLLNSEIAKQFFQAFIFWDSKRPITSSLLNELDLSRLAQEMHCEDQFTQLCKSQITPTVAEQQLSLFS